MRNTVEEHGRTHIQQVLSVDKAKDPSVVTHPEAMWQGAEEQDKLFCEGSLTVHN